MQDELVRRAFYIRCDSGECLSDTSQRVPEVLAAAIRRFTPVQEPVPQPQANAFAMRSSADLRLSIEVANDRRM